MVRSVSSPVLLAVWAGLAVPACHARESDPPRQTRPDDPPAASQAPSLAPIDASPPAAAAPPDAGDAACGGQPCGAPAQCLDGGCCGLLHACQGWDLCCPPDEHCNVYQCYRPLLCGPGFPACPELTYCEVYEDRARECADPSLRRNNEESCARMDQGLAWLAAHARSDAGPRARGVCFPEMAPHRLGGVRWYRSLGKSATGKGR